MNAYLQGAHNGPVRVRLLARIPQEHYTEVLCEATHGENPVYPKGTRVWVADWQLWNKWTQVGMTRIMWEGKPDISSLPVTKDYNLEVRP